MSGPPPGRASVWLSGAGGIFESALHEECDDFRVRLF
jgi:hypothetical protein